MDYPILFDGDMLLERVGNSVDTAIQSITGAKNFGLIVKRLRAFDGADGPAQRAEAKRLYGLRVRGQKARERLNQQARDILARVQGDHTKLTDADRDILMQYSGRGGLQSENSLSEYYTPPEIAEGAWDALKANGFENGSVLEPSTGAGVFLGTKPSGVKMVGCEIDETSSGVAGLLNPDDVVRNQSFEQLCATTPDGTFDSVVGNVPFGDTRGKWKQYDTDYQEIKEMERYFVTRAVDKVKPGGLVCLIVPVNIVGDRSGTFQKWRRMLSLKAEFLGAHKLPSGTFGGQNGNGTDTVVDVLVLRKHSAEVAGKVIDMAAKDLEAANVQWPTWIEGEWFRSPEGKRFIHGELMPGFRGDIVKSDLTNAQIKNLLARRFESRIDFAALNAAPTITRNYADGDRRMIAGVEHELVAGEWVKVEALVTHGGLVDQSKYGVATLDEVKDAMMGGRYSLALSFEAAERAVTGEFSSMAERSLVAAIAVAREAPENMRERVYRAALIGYEIELYTVKLNSGEAKTQDLERIQELVAAEVATYGNPANDLAKMMLRADGANRLATFANSMKADGGFNDLLAGKVDRSKGQAYDGDNFADVVRHLTAMNGKPVGLEDALVLYTGAAAVKSLEDAAAFDTVAITVDGLLTTMGRYVSGNVVEKSRDLQAHIARADESPTILSKWQQQIEAISNARTVVGVDAITFSMRGKWYQSDYMEEFLREQGFGDLDWDKEKREWWNEGADGFEKQLGNYLNGRGVGGGVRTAEYKERIAQLEERFNIWMRQHENIDELVSLYNDVFNAHLPHQYDEADLGLEGVSDQVKPHGYQNSAIRRLSEEGRGILGHDVGLGKTTQALALAAYNRQLGRAKRTCIVVPKSVLENWYHEAKQLYGNLDNALFVGFTPVKNKDGVIERKPVLDEKGQPRKNRHTGEIEMRDVLKEDSNALVFEKMHQIPATSASLVIMTKERFGEIPMRAETREGYADKMADMRLLSDAKAKEFLLGEKTSGSYAEAKRSEKYQEMYSRTGGKKKNEFPYFEQMGFDSVIVDECFTYETLVETDIGFIEIGRIVEERLQVKVKSKNSLTHAIEWKPITNWYTNRRLGELIEVFHEHGSFICTTTHSIWVDGFGYKKAGELGAGDVLITASARYSEIQETGEATAAMYSRVRMLQDRVPMQGEFQAEVLQRVLQDAYAAQKPRVAREVARSNASHLRQLAIEGSSKPIYGSKDGKDQPNASRVITSESFASAQGNGAQAGGSRGEWRGDSGSAASSYGSNGNGYGIRCAHKINQACDGSSAKLLQGGFGVSANEAGSGVGRKFSQINESSEDGREEAEGVVSSGVVGIAVLKQDGDGEYRFGGREHSFVYDIEVEDNHNYFANGVLVSNCHEFKNAYEANSQTSKLAYLPTAPASKRSIDMAAKMAYLREKNGGRGPVLMTATPITNSPTEIFNMLSYVMDIEEFEKMGITSVDDFILHYCETKVVDVVKLSGKVEAKEAVVGFRNLDGLRNLFNRFANIKKAADVNDAANSLKIPEANEVLATANMLPEQQLLYEELRLQAEGIETIDGEQYQVEEKDRRPVFAIIRDMDRVTTDLDLYNRTMTFTFAAADRAKLDKLVQDLPQSLSNTLGDAEDGDDVEREEVLLADAMSVESDGKNVTLKVPEAYEDEVVRRLSKFGITENTVAHPVTPKYAKMLENLRAEYEVGGKQIVFTEEKSQHNKIKRLIVHHLPVSASEIEIINAQTASGDKLEKISAAYNTGAAKIVIANRKAEVGVNLQRGTTAIHHLTLPWTPASIQQRNGRGVRQGNTASKVDVFYYVGKGSFDQYRLDMLKRKADWLDSLFTGKESRAENANAGVSDEYAAMLAADPEEFKRRIEAQKAAKAANEREQRNLRAAIDLHQLSVAKRVLSKIEQRRAAALEEAKDDGERNGINARFDEMRRKNERKVRTLTDGLLSQQDGGKIDVDAKMLIETGQYAVDTNGSIIRAGGFYQYKRDGSYGDKKVILEVTSVDAEARTITGKLALGNDHPVEYALRNGKSMPINNLPRGLVEVKLNRQQMAQERMQAKPYIEYDDLFNSDLRVGAEWLAVAQREKGCSGIALVRNAAGQYALTEGDFKPMPEGLSLVYPEPESAAYRDALGPLLVPHIGENRYSTSISGQAIRLAMMVFGDDWEQAVAKYGQQADAAQIEQIATEATASMLASAEAKGDDLDGKIKVLRMSVTGAELKAKEIAKQAGYSNVVEIVGAAVAKVNAALDQAQTELQAKNDAEIAARKARIAQMQADAASNPDQTKAIEVVRRVWGASYDSVNLTEEKAQAISQAQFMLADAVLQLIQSGNTPKEVMEKAESVGQRLHGEMNATAFGMTQLAIGQRATSAAALTLYPDIIHPSEITKATAAYIGSFGEHQVGRVVAMVVPHIAKELAMVEPAQDAKSLTKAWEKFTSTLMASWDNKSYGSLSGFGDFSRQGPRRNAINAILATCQAGFMARFGAAAGQESTPAAAPASAAVPDSLIAAFASSGIQAKTNTAAVMWSDRNKGKQAMAEPGTRLFFFDPKGRGGPLNTMAQDWLKREYGAVWSADFATGFTGLWWHIPVAGVDFEKLERKVKQ